MANVKVTWVLPSTRESGKPLQLGDIDYVAINISSDGGLNYGEFGQYEVGVTETTVTDLEPGEWFFSAIVVDTAGRPSKAVKKSIIVPDTSPPSGVVSLVLEL